MDASPASTRLREFVSFQVASAQPLQASALKILIVDNDERSASDVRRQLASFRADLDDHVKCARHGLDALVIAEEFQPNLVIIQLGLPRRSASCTAKLLRGRPWANQVVIVSHASTDSPVSEAAIHFDFNFSNGLDVALLMQIHRNLQKRRQTMGARS